MRRTGKLYTLTLVSSSLTVFASILVCLWGPDTSAFHLWLDLFPQGFGMASFITSTLIVSIDHHFSEKRWKPVNRLWLLGFIERIWPLLPGVSLQTSRFLWGIVEFCQLPTYSARLAKCSELAWVVPFYRVYSFNVWGSGYLGLMQIRYDFFPYERKFHPCQLLFYDLADYLHDTVRTFFSFFAALAWQELTPPSFNKT